MLQEFRRDKRDHYFLGHKGSCNDLNPSGMWRKVPEKRKGRGLWYSLSGYALSLIGAAIVAMRIIADLW